MDWYYVAGSQQMGPVSDAHLSELEATGQINPDTLVWRTGLEAWSPLNTVRPQPPPHPPSTFTTNRFCSECGKSYPSSDMVAIGAAVICANCKDAYVQRLREGDAPAVHRTYAGFWIRFVAACIDWVILTIGQIIVFRPLLLGAGVKVGDGASPIVVFAWLLSAVLTCLYEAYFVAAKGGTLGKLALSLRVIRSDGSRPTFRLALGRYFARILSYVTLYIGFIMSAFDEEKRTLHDRICDTRVVRKV